MITFLPYPSFMATAICLDSKRLNKQVLEAAQLYKTIRGVTTGWSNHPAAKMWDGYSDALYYYTQTMCKEAIHRGIKCSFLEQFSRPIKPVYPTWLGDARLHDSHKSQLLRKYPAWYGQFEWDVPVLDYFWPEERK